MEEFGYKIGESYRATDWECEADRIMSSEHDYVANQAGLKAAAREKFLVAAFLIGADRRQYRGMMTQLRNYYAKGQQTYPSTLQRHGRGRRYLSTGPMRGCHSPTS